MSRLMQPPLTSSPHLLPPLTSSRRPSSALASRCQFSRRLRELRLKAAAVFLHTHPTLRASKPTHAFLPYSLQHPPHTSHLTPHTSHLTPNPSGTRSVLPQPSFHRPSPPSSHPFPCSSPTTAQQGSSTQRCYCSLSTQPLTHSRASRAGRTSHSCSLRTMRCSRSCSGWKPCCMRAAAASALECRHCTTRL